MINNKKIFSILFSQTKDLIFFIGYSFLSSLFVVFDVLVMKGYIDNVLVKGKHEDTSLYVGLFIGIFVLFVINIILKSRTKTILTTKISSQLMSESYANILNAEIRDSEKENVKDNVSSILKYCEEVSNGFFKNNVLKFIETLILTLVLFTATIFIKPILCLIPLVGMPIFFILDKGMEKIIKHGNKYREIATKNLNEKISDSYKQVKTIKLLNSSEYEISNFENLTSEYLKANNHQNFTDNLSGKVLEVVFISISLAVILGLSGFLSVEDSYNITGGTVLSFLLIVPYLFMNFKTMISCNIFTSSISDVLEKLDIFNSLKSEKKSEPVNELEEVFSLKFKDVKYVNENNNLVVNNVSFEIKRGEKLGILTFEEETKNAIFDMITKLDKPKSGEISINNCDINKLKTEYLRDLVTSVFPHKSHIEGNIVEYVSYPYDFDEYKLNDALYRSGIKDFVSELPDKELTSINDSKITNEVLQRLLFANAFYKDSKIYLLKDATKNLSVSTELDMMNEVTKLKNRIVITITDRAYCLNKYDKILVIKNGEVIEYGEYKELMQNKTSVFYKLVRKPSQKITNIS